MITREDIAADQGLADNAAKILDSRTMEQDISCHVVRDWLVAGSLMELCESVEWTREQNGYVVTVWANGDGPFEEDSTLDSLPRAIIEACVAALATVESSQNL
jgi:hypothetical protein